MIGVEVPCITFTKWGKKSPLSDFYRSTVIITPSNQYAQNTKSGRFFVQYLSEFLISHVFMHNHAVKTMLYGNLQKSPNL